MEGLTMRSVTLREIDFLLKICQ